MPKSHFYCSHENAYHVINRCINKDWFSMPLEDVWPIMEDFLYLTKHSYKLKIYALVLMENHYHMIVTSPEVNLSEAIKYFQRNVSLQITKAQGRINHLWARRFRRCEIKEYHYFLNCYRYVYQNPLRAGISQLAEEYPFSTLPGLLGRGRLIVPVEEDTLLFNGDVSENLKWIN